MNLETFKMIMQDKSNPKREDLIQMMYEATVREVESAMKNLESLKNETFDEDNKEKIIELKKAIDKDTALHLAEQRMKDVIDKINSNFSPNPLLPALEEVTYWYYIDLLAQETENEPFKKFVNKLRKEYNEEHYKK